MSAKKRDGMEWVEEAIVRVNRTIELNKSVSGIDFSHFLGHVIWKACNLIFRARIDTKGVDGWLYDKETPVIELEEWTESFVFADLQLAEVEEYLSVETGKIVFFDDVGKAFIALGQVPCGKSDEESETIEKFALELLMSQNDREINNKAFRKFLSGYRR
jgi:hypothetical protein